MTTKRARRFRAGILACLVVSVAPPAFAAGPEDYELMRKGMLEGLEDAFEEKPWVEGEWSLPALPSAKGLVPIEVGSLTDNVFAVDEQSVSYGADNVIRYTLVVTSPSGVANISYEGMRCATAERRLYAIGRGDGSWAKARNDAWVRIVENSLNRQYAALFRDYFCTVGGMVFDTESARGVLANGNPAATIR